MGKRQGVWAFRAKSIGTASSRELRIRLEQCALGFALGILISGLSPSSARADAVEQCAEAADNWQRLAACTEVIESDVWQGPAGAWAWSNRAMANAALENHLAAFDDHDEALRLDPFNPRAWNNRATSHAAFREYDRALKDYAEALELDPNYVTALINRASVYEETGAPALARSDYTKAIEIEAAAGRPTEDLLFLRADAACRLGEAAPSIRDRQAAFESGLFPRERMAETLRNTGYLKGDLSGFDNALASWSSAGCPWE